MALLLCEVRIHDGINEILYRTMFDTRKKKGERDGVGVFVRAKNRPVIEEQVASFHGGH